jgi:hypothetical protein
MGRGAAPVEFFAPNHQKDQQNMVLGKIIQISKSFLSHFCNNKVLKNVMIFHEIFREVIFKVYAV